MSEWRTIKDYPDYEVSDDGVIVSHKYKKSRIMKTRKDRNGYLLVGISKNNVTKTAKVHRLVAEMFIPNPNNLPVVRHLNDIPNDNRIENLAWGTPKDNTADLIKMEITVLKVQDEGEKRFLKKTMNIMNLIPCVKDVKNLILIRDMHQK